MRDWYDLTYVVPHGPQVPASGGNGMSPGYTEFEDTQPHEDKGMIEPTLVPNLQAVFIDGFRRENERLTDEINALRAQVADLREANTQLAEDRLEFARQVTVFDGIYAEAELRIANLAAENARLREVENVRLRRSIHTALYYLYKDLPLDHAGCKCLEVALSPPSASDALEMSGGVK